MSKKNVSGQRAGHLLDDFGWMDGGKVNGRLGKDSNTAKGYKD